MTSWRGDKNLHTMIAGSTLGVAQAWVNSVGAGTATLDSGLDAADTGVMSLDGAFQAVGFVQAVIFYTADKSADRTAIESALNGYFNIYS